MLERLLERGKTSGREDDNEESIKKRFRELFPFFCMFTPTTYIPRRCLQRNYYAGYRALQQPAQGRSD